MAINIIDPQSPGRPHVDSYWAQTAGDEVENTPSIRGDIDIDVAIIGGGYTGLSTAYHLAKEFGQTAHVLEANQIGWGCSGRNGGFASIGIGKSSIDGWIRRWGLEGARNSFEQSRDAVRLVHGLLREEAIDAQPTPDGGLELAHQPSRVKNLIEDQRFMKEKLGVETRILSKQELERDHLISREAHGALFYEEGFALHALRYARGMARAAQKHGAILHSSSPVQAWRRDGKRHLLSTPGGIVRANQVVIAGNGYTGDRLHSHINGRLLPVLSNIIVTRPLTEAERQSVNWLTYRKIWDTRHLLFYYRLLPDNRILFGARGGIEDTPESRAERRAWLIRRLGEMFPPLAKVDIEYFWNGWVCATYDKNPHVGTSDEGTVHYALGYIGTGVALSTYCGRLLAHQLTGSKTLQASSLLRVPLPRFPFPAFRRVYQRVMYQMYEFQDQRS
ncbi:NAD(P)/FAD-dependent oxidoreductase [Dongia soli]|uniref:FAD-binding oxidoreductase n=1 Tax=Dongia soli TaxID=600628 RepID=A0ABU5EBU8_9PROT|nr:FAD-binding oxidoreductase [Dongia soli]MDY0883857.1 FAD-binding oxidoreductase [Dongia soli]